MTPTSTKPTTLICLRHGGTHLIQPIIRHLTGKAVYTPKGEHAILCVPQPRLVVFLRDPRDRMVSQFRYKRGRDCEPDDRALAKMLSSRKGGENPVAFMLRWAERWTRWPDAHLMRFERMATHGLEETAALRAYLAARDFPGELGSPAEAFRYAFGNSGTFTGRHSRWREWFGPKSLRAWAEHGGQGLVSIMGYEQ